MESAFIKLRTIIRIYTFTFQHIDKIASHS